MNIEDKRVARLGKKKGKFFEKKNSLKISYGLLISGIPMVIMGILQGGINSIVLPEIISKIIRFM